MPRTKHYILRFISMLQATSNKKKLFPILNKLLSEEALKDMGNRILLLKQKQLIEA